MMPPLHFLLLFAICLIWAGNFIAAAFVVGELEPITFTVARYLLVLALVFPLLRWPEQRQWGRLIACCWTMGALHFGLVFLALGRSNDVSSVALLMQIYIPMSTLLAIVLLGERIGWRSATGIAIAFGGVMVMGLDPLVLSQLDVVVLVLLSAFVLAVGTILMRGLKGISVLNFQAWNAALSLPPLLLLAFWIEQPASSLIAAAGRLDIWLALAYSAIGASIIGHGGFYWLIQRHEVNRITPYLLLVPVLAVLLGVLVWGDRPGPRLLLGGGLVLVGVLWVTLRARFRRAAPEPTAPSP
ncbi:MAG: DMT family transporter [Wenzhouxiangella sp.]|nr:MAG: DMT family transporter [Wenzhouxiangella sp.]